MYTKSLLKILTLLTTSLALPSNLARQTASEFWTITYFTLNCSSSNGCTFNFHIATPSTETPNFTANCEGSTLQAAPLPCSDEDVKAVVWRSGEGFNYTLHVIYDDGAGTSEEGIQQVPEGTETFFVFPKKT
jgi:hypothetical protein